MKLDRDEFLGLISGVIISLVLLITYWHLYVNGLNLNQLFGIILGTILIIIGWYIGFCPYKIEWASQSIFTQKDEVKK